MKLVSTQAILSFVTAMAATPSWGAAASSLRKLVPAPGDSCSGAIPIAVGSTVFGSTSTATADAGIGSCGTTYNGAPGVWYTVTGTGAFLEANTCGDGTNYDTKLFVYSGPCDSLTCITGNDNDASCYPGRSRVSWYANPSVAYYIFVHGVGVAIGSFQLQLQSVTPPDNDSCSEATPIAVGETVSGSTSYATADAGIGDCGVTYNVGTSGVWYKVTGTDLLFEANTCGGGTNYDTKLHVYSGSSCGSLACITGNDDSCPGFRSRVQWLAIPGVVYYIFVHGFLSARGSFQLQLQGFSPPDNDSCSLATPIAVGATLFGSTLYATADTGIGTCVTTYSGTPGVWYKVTGTGEFFEASTCGGGTSYDTSLHVYSGFCDSLICITGNNDNAFCGTRSIVGWYAIPGVVYYIFVHGSGSSKGNFQLQLQSFPPPENDNACNALEITVNDPEAYANAYAFVQAGEVTPGAGTGISTCNAQDGWCSFDTNVQNSIWFSFTPEQDGCVDIFTDNTDDLQLAVWQVDGCADFNTYTEVAANDDSGPGNAPRIIYAKVEAALPYLIQLDGYKGIQSSGNLIVGERVDTTPPQVLCEPGVNPGGEKPDPDSNSGFYKLMGFDDCNEPQLYVRDTVSGTEFGPFESGAYIKYVAAKGGKPSMREMNGAVDFMIKGNGPAEVVAVDGAGNTATTACAYWHI